jgi:hypothetical protein
VVQDLIEALASVIVGVGAVGLAALVVGLTVALPLGGLCLLVRFVRWAWMD